MVKSSAKLGISESLSGQVFSGRGGGKPFVVEHLHPVSGLRSLHFYTFGGNNDFCKVVDSRHACRENLGETSLIPSLGGGRSCVILFKKSLQIRERVFGCKDKDNLKSSKRRR